MKKILVLLFVLSLLIVVIKEKTFEDFDKSLSFVTYDNNEIWPPNTELFCYASIPPQITNEKFIKELDAQFIKSDIVKKELKKQKVNKKIKKKNKKLRKSKK